MSTASSSQPAMAWPWLSPAPASLLALTDDPPDVASLRFDPGLLLHVLRYSRPTPDPMTFALDEATLCLPGLCETAASLLEQSAPSQRRTPDAESWGQQVAHLAYKLAAATELCSPDAAWAAGLLAPLGWYCGERDQPLSLVRKLLARWRLPVWVQVALGYLDLPLEESAGLGGHRGLDRVLRASLRVLESQMLPKFARERDDDLDELGANISKTLPAYRECPHSVDGSTLLPRLLRATAKARGRSAQSWVAPLESRIDCLVDQLAEARLDFDHRLRGAKLEALAEFAAGASHEINNPLAVISGNAQWLKAREADPAKAGHLQTVLRQTQRIHDLLTGTRQFSSPSPAKPSLHSLESILNRLQRDFQPEADSLGVRFEIAADSAAFLDTDGEQLRTALGHLLRNALEAAGPGGWVKLRSIRTDSSTILQVEDSGPGPDERAQEHLFDPFFSGRAAGRGRGLGLSIAWALARNNGGDLRWIPGEPTCFKLTLPVAIPLSATPARHVA